MGLPTKTMSLFLMIMMMTTVQLPALARVQPIDEWVTACSKPGGVPDPTDSRYLLLCEKRGHAVGRVSCPTGFHASAVLGTCEQEPRKTRQLDPQPEASGSCQTAGLRCADCDTLNVCSLVNGQPTAVANVSCKDLGSALSCNPDSHMCMPGICTVSGPSAFRCLDDATLPDPTDCKRYHLCRQSPRQHFSGKCDVMYDAEAGSCTAIVDPSCNPLKPCGNDIPTSSGLPGRQGYYRVCIPQGSGRFETLVLRCPEGQSFVDTKGACAYLCTKGKKARLPDPDDCHAFFECTGDDQEARRSVCVPGFAYDAIKGSCALESKVAACVPPTTTSAPSSPSSATQPATSAPSNPPECARVGNMADPLDCHRYYECVQPWFFPRLVRNQRYCPYQSYFDRKALQCMRGSC